MKYGKACMDALGAKSVATSFQVMRAATSYVSAFLATMDGFLAFYPELVEFQSLNDEPRKRMRFNTQAIAKPTMVGEVESLRAPASDENISKLGTVVKNIVTEKGSARLTAIGSESLNRLVKSVIRANEFIAQQSEEDGSERLYIWMVPEVRDASSDIKRLYAVELVKGPKPDLE